MRYEKEPVSGNIFGYPIGHIFKKRELLMESGVHITSHDGISMDGLKVHFSVF